MTSSLITNLSIQAVDSAPVKVRSEPIRVMQLTDSLSLGGTERVAVNLANRLCGDRYKSYLCTTRCGGPLSDLVEPHVERIDLARKRRFDIGAIRRLVNFIRQHRIQILHAHSSSLLVANIASRFAPYPKIVWHDHFGRFEVEQRPAWQFRMITRRVAGVIAVTKPLADWSTHDLRIPADRVWYLPNFPSEAANSTLLSALPGEVGQRIVCVANLRPEKDHPTLVDAMKIVVESCPNAQLLLIGNLSNETQVQSIRERIRNHRLDGNIHVLGPRQDVAAILRACDVGVLSSVSEGLPLSLLEYGLAGLPVVATDVGQCRDVLNNGDCGALVASGRSKQIAHAIINLLTDRTHRQAMALKFQKQVKSQYSAEAAIANLGNIYQQILTGSKGGTSIESC